MGLSCETVHALDRGQLLERPSTAFEGAWGFRETVHALDRGQLLSDHRQHFDVRGAFV